MKYDFMECKECAAKPGSPQLCEACLRNRDSLSKLSEILDRQKETLDIIRKIAGL